jgi:hypothetical protein
MSDGREFSLKDETIDSQSAVPGRALCCAPVDRMHERTAYSPFT